MEKSDRSEQEETVQEGLHVQDAAVCQVPDVDLDGLQSDRKVELQKNGDTTKNVVSKLGVTQKLMQQEKEVPAKEVPTQDSQQKSEEIESSQQEYLVFAEDEELEHKTDANIMAQQKDESSFALEQDSSQTNQPESDTVHQECDVFVEDKPLELNGNTTVQRTAETPEDILLVQGQESIQITEQEDNDGTHQEWDTVVEDESLQAKFETYLSELLNEESVEERLIAPFEDPLHAAEQETNDIVKLEWDRSTENDRHFQESDSNPESEESHIVYLQTRQLEEEEVTTLPLPSRICHHRTHIMRHQRLPMIPEEPDLPLSPFVEEIIVRRNRRTLGARLPTLPTGMRDYMQRVRDRHIPPERQALYEELQTRCVKLFFSLLIGGILVVALYFLIDFLESKDDNNHYSNVTAPPDFLVNLNVSMSALEPKISVTYLDVNIITSMADLGVNITTPMADLGVNITTPMAGLDVNFNGTNPMIDLG